MSSVPLPRAPATLRVFLEQLVLTVSLPPLRRMPRLETGESANPEKSMNTTLNRSCHALLPAWPYPLRILVTALDYEVPQGESIKIM